MWIFVIIAFLLWIAYASIEGVREAYYYSLKVDTDKFSDFNEHPMFTVQRAFVLLLAVFTSVHLGWLVPLMMVASMALVFPFMHDGWYYITRKKLDGIYPKGWADHSTTSTSKLTKFLTFPVRTIMFSIGVVLAVVMFVKIIC